MNTFGLASEFVGLRGTAAAAWHNFVRFALAVVRRGGFTLER